jgi:hypothetical protein
MLLPQKIKMKMNGDFKRPKETWAAENRAREQAIALGFQVTGRPYPIDLEVETQAIPASGGLEPRDLHVPQ